MVRPQDPLSASAEVDQDDSKPRVQTAVRTVAILLCVARSGNGLKAKEISEQLDLPRQVTYHLLHTMLGTGILRRNAQNRYVLGLAAAPIAEGFRRQIAPPELIAPKVRAAVAATGETAYASGWIDGRIVVLATARPGDNRRFRRLRCPTAIAATPTREPRASCCWP
ncbi:helix-turn-helix domain-containing protein [Mesorhizobium sp. AR07]|uniref:helix-turn-helix domain-containing protein n=1 Tax=Mesorhizobium sp. AR07 TaxID=2865838 RepID=UPI00215F7327|nr:helix-turn-helix domain-containing protein [Mesorhizobium sp. AR07]UVK43875.1 helix-turn-helix domain-containing protein [Mesorhizobium sp. AR07]